MPNIFFGRKRNIRGRSWQGCRGPLCSRSPCIFAFGKIYVNSYHKHLQFELSNL